MIKSVTLAHGGNHIAISRLPVPTNSFTQKLFFFSDNFETVNCILWRMILLWTITYGAIWILAINFRTHMATYIALNLAITFKNNLID